MSLVLTEQLVATIAPGEGTLRDGRALVTRGAYRALQRTEDGTLVSADCAGSGKEPYKVALDLGAGTERPAAWCSCPSRAQPCKHAVGLMLAYLARPGDFAVAPPSEAALRARAEGPRSATTPPPRGANRVAAARKVDEQAAALEALENLLVDLVAAGLGGLDAAGVATIETQANRMGDADLGGARGLLRRLAVALTEAEGDARGRRAAAVATQLWVTARRGRAALAARASDDAGPADAHLEALLGRRWRLEQLRDAGCGVQDLTLLELAHERLEDAVSETVLTSGWLLDLATGAVHVERSIIPFKALHATDVRHRASRLGVLRVREGVLYPGAVVNRRVRWAERDPDVVTERPREPGDHARVHALAAPFGVALDAWRRQLRDPLADRDAVVLLAVARVGLAGDDVALEDAAGARLVVRDPPRAACPTAAAFRRAAAARGAGSVAARLWYHAATGVGYAQPLALLAGDAHLRLGR